MASRISVVIEPLRSLRKNSWIPPINYGSRATSFVRLQPEYLYPCLGEADRPRSRRNCHAGGAETGRGRDRAAQEIHPNVFQAERAARRADRVKLTVIGAGEEHARRARRALPDSSTTAARSAPTPPYLGRCSIGCCRDPIFQKELFGRFPFKRASTPKVWNRFLKETSPLATLQAGPPLSRTSLQRESHHHSPSHLGQNTLRQEPPRTLPDPPAADAHCLPKPPRFRSG